MSSGDRTIMGYEFLRPAGMPGPAPTQAARPESPPQPRYEPGSAAGAGRQHLILVVDDEPDSLRILLEMMRGFGLDLAAATSWDQGLRTARIICPDLILLDVMLPDGDGYTLCRSLRDGRKTRDIPVIFLTARAGIDDKGAGFAAGAVDYITKPFESKEVLLRIVNHLGLARRQRVLKERLSKYERPLDDQALAAALVPSPAPPGTPPAALRILTRARDLLLKDLRDPPNLADLAAHACTNRTTLGQLFKQYLGMTVFDYLREQRLNEGRRLLVETDLAIKVIAETVGYTHSRDFANAFKDRFGLTPAAYRGAPPNPAPNPALNPALQPTDLKL